MTAAANVVSLGGGIGKKPSRVALAGCPNVGKTSLFNALTGLRQKVGNYPGITVERRSGTMSTPAGLVELVDLPGTYSLLPRSPDEAVARDELLGRIADVERPDVVVAVADAAHLERSLFLISQLLEIGLPIVVALNQVDVGLDAGVQVDAKALEEILGVPVIPTSGRTGAGKSELASDVAKGGRRGRPARLSIPPEIDVKAGELSGAFSAHYGGLEHARRGLGALLGSHAASETRILRLLSEGTPEAASTAETLRAARTALAAQGVDVDTATAQARYRWAEGVCERVVTRVDKESPWRYRLDKLLVHPLLGSLVLAAIFTLLFQVVYSWSGPAIDFVDEVINADLGNWVAGVAGDGLLGEFLQNGVVAGFGAFLVFVPQIAMLFVLIEALEDSGYLARAAFLLDRVMGAAGLPGRAFLPMLSGFACAIPGIIATRSIESKTDRFITIMVLPLMSCSARLPVYAVIVGALFEPFGGWTPSLVVMSMYLLGIALAFAGAKVLRRTVAAGPRSPLLLELPPYRLPSVKTVLENTFHRTWSFVKGAGPIIFVLSIVLWGTLTFPKDVQFSKDFDGAIAQLEEQAEAAPEDSRAAFEEQIAALQAEQGAERTAQSFMGRTARAIEPVFEPLGFDWKIDVAVLGSFAAREVFVPTLGIIYAVGDEADETDQGLLDKMRIDKRPDGSPVFTPLVGISILVFYVIALQCISTLAVIKRETNSWKWTLGVFAALTAVAYVASLLVFQIGSALGF